MPLIIGCTPNRVKQAPRIQVLRHIGQPNRDLLSTVALC